LQVLVRDNNVDQALRVLKKKMQREGILRELKLRKAYEKPSERKAREKGEAIRRARKQACKSTIREGLIVAPKPKPRFGGGPASARTVVRRWATPASLRRGQSLRINRRARTRSGVRHSCTLP
jgi:small subunit ribosomal protein S21